MNIKTFYNGRNEAASTDGARWWSGTATDEQSIAFGELQPMSALLPEDVRIPHAIIAKARAVFISALRKTAPTVVPDDDSERAILRKAWDDATAFAATHKIVNTGVPVFDGKLMVVGTADAYLQAADLTYTYCYAPDGWEWAGTMNALVRTLSCGFPMEADNDIFGCYTLRDFARAMTALTFRTQTKWYIDHQKEMPF